MIVFIYELSYPDYGLIFREYGIIPIKLFYPSDVVPLYEKIIPFFTSMFLHGGFMHLFGNMYYLYIFGDNVEDRLGHFKYLLFYLFFGLMAALLQILIDPYSEIPMVGASGAISGVMGFYMISFPYSRIKTLVVLIFFITIVEIPAFFFLIFWFYMQFIYGTAASLMEAQGGVAWWAHIGGFVAGVIVAIIYRKRGYDYYVFRVPW
ncbi:MAG: rhomboid family intramembrane serine protease [Calditerrivibrio sp.]|nr:rhomboid family intramembrane serine protease [Calditerrivibrio sp.]